MRPVPPTPAHADAGRIGRWTAGIQAELRSFGAVVGAWLRRRSYLQKWIVLGVAIGIISGLGTVVFYLALQGAGHLLLEGIGGYAVPTSKGEGGGTMGDGAHFSRWWAVPLVVALGGLLSGLVVTKFAPEAEGHGTDAAIDAVHRNPRGIDAKAVAVKIVASAITIGSGGSGGREGPTAHISAGFGSLLARTLDLSPEDGRIALSIGIGSGIGAIFGAPLGGAVLAASLIYRDDFESQALIPGLITSIVSYTVFGFILGFQPMFGYAIPGYQFDEPIQLLWFALIGIVAGFVGLLYSGVFHRFAGFFRGLRLSPIVKPAVGGFIVGLIALAIPQVLGTGYGWVQASLSRHDLLGIPLWIILVLPIARIVATGLSIGSGGSGGIFGPGMVIGAFTGGAIWRVLETMPLSGVSHSPAPFVIVGMMACFGAIARAPLAIMLMVAEMTGSLTILAPAMVAVGLAYLIVRHTGQTIYRSQLVNREEAQAVRLKQGLPLLGRVEVADAMSPPRVLLPDTTSSDDALARLHEKEVPGAPIVDGRSQFLGIIDTADLERRAGSGPVGRRVDTSAATVPVDANLDQAIEAMPVGTHWLTVLDEERRVHGILAFSDIVRAYHRVTRAEARQVSRVSGNAVVSDLRVAKGSPVVGHALREDLLPDGVIVVAVRRADGMVLGLGSVRLRAGDEVTVLARPDTAQQVRELFGVGQSASA